MPDYYGRLLPVQVGQVITIQGKSLPCANRFDVNLKSEAEVQLHLSIRFEGVCEIVRNVLSKGVGWGCEERQENLISHNVANPIKRGGDFKIAIYVDSSIFFVSIDEKPFCLFPHRKPLHDIKFVEVTKDVERFYRVDQTTAQPSRWPAVNDTIFKSFIPKPFSPGDVVTLTAIPKGNRGDFTVDFYDCETRRIWLHFRVYVGQSSISLNDQDITRNWRKHVTYRPSPFPIIMNQEFKLAFEITNSSFSIAINGKQATTFPFRDESRKIFGSATGFSFFHEDRLTLEVKGVDYNVSGSNSCGC